MINIRTIFLASLVFLMMVSRVESQSTETILCSVPPACETLGFIQSESDCEGAKEAWRCPTAGSDDEVKYYCYECDTNFEWDANNNRCNITRSCGWPDLIDAKELLDGKSITKKQNKSYVDQSCSENSAVNKAITYNPTEEKISAYAAGKWYIPSLGEWMSLYGYDNCEMGTEGTSGMNPSKGDLQKVQEALNTLSNKLENTAATLSGNYWTSTPSINQKQWIFNPTSGTRTEVSKSSTYKARYFNLLEDQICPKIEEEESAIKIEVGDIMYDELKDTVPVFGKASAYSTDKKPIGIVVWVSESKHSVKIMSLLDVEEGQYVTEACEGSVTGITDFSAAAVREYFLESGNCGNICDQTDTYTEWKEGLFFSGLQASEVIKNKNSVLGNKIKEFCIKNATGDCILNQHIAKGTWYVPSLGEWMELRGFQSDQFAEDVKTFRGCTDPESETPDCGQGSAGVFDSKAYNALASDYLGGGSYWTSTEVDGEKSWLFEFDSGARSYAGKTTKHNTAYVNFLSNVFCHSHDKLGSGVLLGQEVYYASDGTLKYGNETPNDGIFVGYVIQKSDNGQSVKVINFDSADGCDNNANGVYCSAWGQGEISDLKNYASNDVLDAYHVSQDGVASCHDKTYRTMWDIDEEMISADEVGDNLNCEQKYVYKKRGGGDGETITCYAKKCLCKENEVYTFIHTSFSEDVGEYTEFGCQPAYESCIDFANQQANSSTPDKKIDIYDNKTPSELLHYATASSDRWPGAFPYNQESLWPDCDDCVKSTNYSKFLDGDPDAYVVITLKNGYKERCFKRGYRCDATEDFDEKLEKKSSGDGYNTCRAAHRTHGEFCDAVGKSVLIKENAPYCREGVEAAKTTGWSKWNSHKRGRIELCCSRYTKGNDSRFPSVFKDGNYYYGKSIPPNPQ